MFSFRRAIHKIGRIIHKTLPCSQGISGSGGAGVYYLDLNVGTDIGLTGIKYNGQGVPDWFRIYWDGNLVANSRYVGDNITQANPTGGIPTGTFTLDEYNYTGGMPPFQATGTTTSVTVTSGDIADRVNQASDGNGYLLFNKTTAEPSTIRIVVVGNPNGGTQWNIAGICPTPQTVTGKIGVYYGFNTSANKALTTGGTIRLILVNTNFYTSEIGTVDFAAYGWNGTNAFINDGVTWYEIDGTGNVLNSGLI